MQGLDELVLFDRAFRIARVISGGQTGADRAGLVAGKACGVETGGHTPKGYRTQAGPDLSLRDEFGLSEHLSPEYPPRTELNVKNAHITLIFGNEDSSGCSLTKRYCRKWGRPFMVINSFSPDEALAIRDAMRRLDTAAVTINVAGNREETNPGIFERARDFMTALISLVNEA
jgi:hypothetical protein